MSTLNSNPIAKAVRYALIAGTAAAVAMPAAYAAEEDDKGEKVVITGSRIKRQDIETAAPVQVITREQIDQTGLTSIGDILQNIPAAGSAINTTFNNGGDGSTSIDLRNMGSNRLLVLINGRRWGAGIGGSVDLNNIPVSIIERVEVLKDGASAIYGSDAITGVVNIVTRSDFQGMDAEAYTGAFDEGDGNTQHFNFGIGMTGEKGSAYVNVSYTKQEPVMAGDRPISSDPVYGAPTNYAGSSGTPLGRFVFYDDTSSLNGCDPADDWCNLTLDGVNGGLTPWVEPTSRYNYAPENFLLTPQERRNLYAQASYELSDNLGFRTEIFYGNRKSDQLLAPTPLFIGPWGGGNGADIGVSVDNPYNITNQDLVPAQLGGNFYFLGRRMIEAKHRDFIQDVDHWQFSAGLNGSFELGTSYFEWDFNYTYSNIQQNDITEGLLNMDRVAMSLSGTPCEDDVDCVHLNLFGGATTTVGNGSMTEDMLNYITFVAQDASGSENREYTFNISGELFELPGGPMGVAAGLAKRWESGYDQPDALIAAGITSGNSRLGTSGGYDVDEFYVEFALPVLDNLEMSIASRYSDYSNFGGTTNSKFGIKYDITDELSVRGTYAEAFRAPSIFEQFQGAGDSYPTIGDPCSGYGSLPNTPENAVVIANCQADGVPTSYTQPNQQIRITVGGNTDLGPEDAISKTFGVVYSPSYVENLSITVDWYRIDLENGVGTVGAQTILNECYTTTARGLCDNITRGSTGTVDDLFNGRININEIFTEGFDLNVAYKFDTGIGEFAITWDTSYVAENGQKVDSGTLDDDGNPIYIDIDYAGMAFDRTVLPRIRSNLQTVWRNGDWEVSWMMRHISGTWESCPFGSSEPASVWQLCSGGSGWTDTDTADEPEFNRLGGTTYHDTQLSYNWADMNTRVVLGINNIGDKQPPASYTTFANSFDPTMYEVPGRAWYVRLKHDF